MFQVIVERFRQKKRTSLYPATAPVLPERFRGRPHLDAGRCRALRGENCPVCADVCPTGAIRAKKDAFFLDMGLCLFCGACATACPDKAVLFSKDHRLAARCRDDMVVSGAADTSLLSPLDKNLRSLFKR